MTLYCIPPPMAADCAAMGRHLSEDEVQDYAERLAADPDSFAGIDRAEQANAIHAATVVLRLAPRRAAHIAGCGFTTWKRWLAEKRDVAPSALTNLANALREAGYPNS